MSGPAPRRSHQDQPSMSAKALQEELTEATASSIRNRSPKFYKKSTALLMHFADDDIGCDDLKKELADIFKNTFGFNKVRRTLLGTKMQPIPQLAFNRIIDELYQEGCCDKDCLVILVFSGHGMPRQEKTSDDIIQKLLLGGALTEDDQGQRTFRTPVLDWVDATSIFKQFGCDVVHILDCCYAAEAMRADAELLAAATETASGDFETCFTKGLITTLQNMASTSLFTIHDLFQRMRNDREKLKLLAIPYHQARKDHHSIVLRNPAFKGKAVVPKSKPNDRRILLTAHVDQDFDKDSVERLKKWLSGLPLSLTEMDIKLEGTWDSSSSILLFSLPISVWTMLDRDNMAWTYIGEVTSTNQLLSRPSPSTTLAYMPPKGMENRKPGPPSEQSRKPGQSFEELRRQSGFY